MKPGQAAIALLAVIAVAAVYLIAGSGGDDGGGGGNGNGNGGSAGPKAPSGSLAVSFAYSPEKEPLLKPLIEEFNKQGEQVGGRKVFIEGANVSSGDAESRIARGRYKPVAWSPASSLWGRLLNFEADRPLTPDEAPSIVRTPLVIAMWEPMSQALGYPRKPLGFDDILRLARDDRGWSAYGKPQFGRFKLVHTNPDFSTSGLAAVVAEYYAATGKKEGLTEADVSTSQARDTVRGIERSIVHYGDTTLFIADQLRKEGPGYASAVAMEEVTLLDFNRRRGSRPKLVAIYPDEGTFDSDSPFYVLDAEWVTPEQRQGAEAFQRFLSERIDAELAGRFGFRAADREAAPAGLVTAENGADPKQPERVLGLPSPRVLSRIKRSWREDRKPANVLLVLDVSGSMNDEDRLERAKDGLEVFLREVSPADRLALTVFNDQVQPLLDFEPARTGGAKLRRAVRELIADGGTAFHDAAVNGFEKVRRLGDLERINAVVLLTDGEDTDSRRTLDAAVRELESQGDSENRVRVFTIAYSAAAEGAAESLEQIATATGGVAYTAETDDIESVYRSISSFF